MGHDPVLEFSKRMQKYEKKMFHESSKRKSKNVQNVCQNASDN